MKKIITLLLIFTLAVLMAFPAFATNGTIGKYTPVLDGEKDEAYDQSLKLNLFTDQGIPVGEFFHSEGSAPDKNNIDANAWFLYDDQFIYVYVDVADPDLFDIGKATFDSRPNNYQSDSVELWFVFGDAFSYIKFSAVAFGHGMFGDQDGSAVAADVLKPLGFDTAVKTGTAGYAVEFKIPITQYGLKAGDTIYFTLQLNNMDKDGNLAVSGKQLQNMGGADNASALTLGAPIIIVVPEPEIIEEEEPPAEVESPSVPTVVTPSPATGDITVLFGIMSLISAGGLLTFKKKR
ncbi:MAG: hypothetical protein FWF15_04705 [Oscillospiraceae bacterium]|nr:hypothetical protein [Oscillospiraceae bacterium]